MQTSRMGVDLKRIEPLELVAVKNLFQLRVETHPYTDNVHNLHVIRRSDTLELTKT